MHRQAFDRASVGAYVEAVRRQIGSGALSDATARAAEQIRGEGDPAAKVSRALPPASPAVASSGGRQGERVPYLSRDPMVSLVQSAVESALTEQGVPDDTAAGGGPWSKIIRLIQGLLHPGKLLAGGPGLGRQDRGIHA